MIKVFVTSVVGNCEVGQAGHSDKLIRLLQSRWSRTWPAGGVDWTEYWGDGGILLNINCAKCGSVKGWRSVMTPSEPANIDISVLLTIPYN